MWSAGGPSDRRRHLVDVTEVGLAALEQAEAPGESIEDEVLGRLSASPGTGDSSAGCW